MATVVTTIDNPGVRRILGQVIGALCGRGDATLEWAVRGVKLRMAVAWFSKVKQAYVTKARGGTDEAGDSWPALSPHYLAYSRPMAKGGRGSRRPPRGGGLAPGGQDGLLTQTQLRQWRFHYAQALAHYSVGDTPTQEAKSHAAAIAWTWVKRHAGAETKLQKFGRRSVEILRDRGVLFNSLSPGLANDYDAGVQSADQILETRRPGQLVVGTNVAYAAAHHYGRPGKLPQRRLWPAPSRIPATWWDAICGAGVRGLAKAIEAVLRRAA